MSGKRNFANLPLVELGEVEAVAWNMILGGRHLVSNPDNVREMRRYYLGDTELAARTSELLWFQMLVHQKVYGIDPDEILQAIFEVEDSSRSRLTKRESRFNRPPLRGLWHKHYFSARFMAHNLQTELGADGVRKIVEEEIDPKISPVITREMISSLAKRVTEEPLERRFRKQGLTGEWVVFAKVEEVNFYLCLGTHETGDAAISQDIVAGCSHEFPDLLSWFG